MNCVLTPPYGDVLPEHSLLDPTGISEMRKTLSYGDSSEKCSTYGVSTPEALYCGYERLEGDNEGVDARDETSNSSTERRGT